MINLQNAQTFDIETFPNCFTIATVPLYGGQEEVWEISYKRDDRSQLMKRFTWLAQTKTPMIGYNNLHFDYPVIHALFHNPNMTVDEIYAKAMTIIQGNDRYGHTVWASKRFAPQIDLFKLHHLDNRAKATSLKWLQINMRSESVVDMPVEVGTQLNDEQIENYLKPYNVHDIQKTNTFAHYSMSAIEFRISLIEQFGIDVLNWNDTKIGEQTVIKRLGEELCYDKSVKPRKTRQTPRTQISLKDIIFPYVRFEQPEFNRVLDYLKRQTLKSEDIKKFGSDTPIIKTKGVFAGLSAHVGGIEFDFGTGGIHGSVERKRYEATDEWLIQDIDVASLYPSIAISNNLAPAHLGEAFTHVYSELPKERKRWQKEKGKKCVEANALKLAANGVYGKSNSVYSPFYDPQYTMTITINGQLLLSMLAEQLIKVPTLQLIQINTDGMTYVIHKNYVEHTKLIWKWWEDMTGLVLEDVFYKRMFIRDVNSYIAEDLDGDLKLKGAYWTPDPLDYQKSISEAQPPAWHKNLSNIVSTRAAVAAMVHNIPPEQFIRMCTNPYDFCCAVKAKGKDRLFHGNQEVQRTTRYYISNNGEELKKIAPPVKPEGQYKKANGITDAEYDRVMQESKFEWDERVCTKNKSKYETRVTNLVSGYNTSIVNDINQFDFNNINYEWYVAEANKLIV